jgi:integrase
MEQARTMAVAAEARGMWVDVGSSEQVPTSSKSVADAVDEFLSDRRDIKGMNLADSTLVKYQTVLNRLVTFGARTGRLYVKDFGFVALSEFKQTWVTGTIATRNNIIRLRVFFEFCRKYEWITDNPANTLELPPKGAVEREPFTPEEMTAILEASRTITLDTRQPVTNRELETFILVMRHSGISISDAALLQRSELKGDEIRLYRKKTTRSAKRVLVVVPLPPDVVERLKELPLKNDSYFFAHGKPTLLTQTFTWGRRLKYVFKAAGITHDPGSHRFRHTFATDLLTKGYSIERVSRWLGHASIKTTQEHYSHWVEDRIQAASNELRKLYASS